MNVRRELEKKVVRAVITHLENGGWKPVAVDNGGHEYEVEAPYSKGGVPIEEVIEHSFAADEAHIFFSNGKETHYIYLVLGNSPEEVISDYSYGMDNFSELMESFSAEAAAIA